MMLKFALVMFCLLLLQSCEAVKLLARQESPPLTRDCSAQEEQDLLDAFPQECRDSYDVALNLTSVESLLTTLSNLIHFTTLCSETCSTPLLEYMEGCFGTTDGLVELASQEVCLFNMDGTMCYTAIYNSLVQINSWQTQVRAECFVDFQRMTQPLADMDTELIQNCSNAWRGLATIH